MRISSCAGLLLLLASVSSGCIEAAHTQEGMQPSFDVASIRQTSSDADVATNLDLDPSDYFRYPGGPVTASGSLINYIIFAYKIQDRSQADQIYAGLPAWARQTYTLRATIEIRPTKDKLRLMVRSLLAERFQLKLHLEPRRLPVYALMVDHGSAPGLVLEPDDALCAKPLERPKSSQHSGVPPQSCQLVILHRESLREVRMADYTLSQIAGNLVSASLGALAPRTVLDETGLTGNYDLDITFLPSKIVGAEPLTDEPGATFEEALKRQAGLKLVRKIESVPLYVIDHIEPPSAN